MGAARPPGTVRHHRARSRRAVRPRRTRDFDGGSGGAARRRRHAVPAAPLHRPARGRASARYRPLRPGRVDQARLRSAHLARRRHPRGPRVRGDRRRGGSDRGVLGRPRATGAARAHGLRARAPPRRPAAAPRRPVAAQRGPRSRRAGPHRLDVDRAPRAGRGALARRPAVRRRSSRPGLATGPHPGAPRPSERPHPGHRRRGARHRQRDHARGRSFLPRPRRAAARPLVGQHDRVGAGHAAQRALGRDGAGRGAGDRRRGVHTPRGRVAGCAQSGR